MTNLFSFCNMSRVGISLLGAILFANQVEAQVFEIKKIDQASNEITIFYDLEDTGKPSPYFIQLFSSKDNFTNPLVNVRGDVGIGIVAGINRKIIWNMRSDLGDSFIGDIQLEVRGKVYVPFIKLNQIGKNNMIKRATKTSLVWGGEINNKELIFDLYLNDERIQTIPSIANNGKATIVISSKVKPGNSYYFRISEVGNPEHEINTDEFAIKKRFPLIVKLAPAAIVGVVVILLLPDKPGDSVGSPLPPPSGN
jgi:hypothetical protein